MIELKGKFTDCKIFNDDVENKALEQVKTFLDHPAFKDKKTRFMPDIHAGKGAVIGTTVELGDKVIPNVIGVDLNCDMLSVNIGKIDINFKSLDEFITNNIPSGFNVNSKIMTKNNYLLENVDRICDIIGIPHERQHLSIGSLGSGNHYIEVGKDEEDNLWITVHSGSRNFGLQIAKYYQMIAHNKNIKLDVSNIPEKDREKVLTIHRSNVKVPKGMEYLEGEEMNNYFSAMKVAEMFAGESRRIMIDRILDFLNITKDYGYVESVHNYIDFKHGIIRKGATSAQKDELVIIPWNMRDGMIIGKGKGNADWNFSAPHGAGRNMSRTKAKKEITLEEFRDSMEGIYSSSVVTSTLDESPMAYKDAEAIEKYIEPTVEILHRVKPLYNFKAK